jgi:hypothetical protein
MILVGWHFEYMRTLLNLGNSPTFVDLGPAPRVNWSTQKNSVFRLGFSQEDVMKSPQSKLSRRSFLLALGAGGATATAALVGKDGTQSSTSADAQREAKGYRLTEHVQKYYRTTKV